MRRSRVNSPPTCALHQGRDGGWPLYYGGNAEISCSVKAYYALKLAGDSPALPHMVKARETILSPGRRFSRQRLHANRAGNLRADPMAKRAVFAGGMRSTAALVSVSPLQGFLLVTNGHGPVVRSLHTQGARKKSQAGFGPRTFYRRPLATSGLFPNPFGSESRTSRIGSPGAETLPMDAAQAAPARPERSRSFDTWNGSTAKAAWARSSRR